MRRVALGDVVEIVSGQVMPNESPYAEMLHVGGDNIASGSGEIIDPRPAASLGLISGKYLFSEEDILYSKIRPALNKVALPSFSGICSADIYPLRATKQTADRRYLAYRLRHADFLAYAETHSARTNIPKLNRDSLLAWKFMLPPIGEQRRVAAVLSTAESVARKRREALALTDDLLRATFLEMFGDPVANPKNAAVSTLGKEADEFQYGTSVKCSAEAGGGDPVLRIPNIVRGEVDWSDLKYADLDPAERARIMLRRGDLLFVRTNGNPDYIGRCAVFDDSRDCLFASYLIRARFGARLRPEFLRFQLSLPSYRARIAQQARTTAGNFNISVEGLRSLEIIVPSTAAQDSFVARLKMVGVARQQMGVALAEADRLFAALQHRAFRGDL